MSPINWSRLAGGSSCFRKCGATACSSPRPLETITMRDPRSQSGSMRSVTSSAPKKLTARVSVATSAPEPCSMTPALLTSACSLTPLASSCCATASMLAREPTSSWAATTSSPSARSSAAARWLLAPSRAVSSTRARARASCRHTSSPSPRLPPVTRMRAPGTGSLAQQRERVVAGAAAEHVADPDHGQGLQVARALDAAQVDGRAPAQLLAQLAHGLLGIGVVAGQEHVGLSARKAGPDHVRIADDVEAFDHARLGYPALHVLAA